MSVAVKDFLKARRDRVLGSILGYSERTLWQKLTPQERQEFRNVVIDALNSYHDSVLDLVKSDSDVRNERLVELLEQVEAQLRDKRPVPTS